MKINKELIKTLYSKEILLATIAGAFFMGVNFTMLSYMPVYLMGQGYNEFYAGIQNSVFSVASIIFRFYLAPQGDSLGRKKMMLLGSFVFFISPLFLYFFGDNYTLMTLGRTFMGIGMAAFLSAAVSFVADNASAKFRGSAIGFYRGGYSFAMMIGPYYASKIIVGRGGFPLLFLLLAAAGLISFISCIFIKRTVRTEKVKISVFKSSKEILSMKKVRKLLTAIIGISISYGVILSYMAVYIGKYSNIKNTGIYFTIFAVSGLIGNISGGALSDILGRAKTASPMIMLMGLGTLILTLMPLMQYPIVIISGVLCGYAFSSALSIMITWLIDSTPENLRSTAVGLQENCIDGSIALGTVVYGFLSLFVSGPFIFLILGIFAVSLPLFQKLSISDGVQE